MFNTFVGHGFPISHLKKPHTFSTFLRAFTISDHVQPELIGIFSLLTFLRAFTAGDHVQPQLIGIFPFLTFLRAFTAGDHIQLQLIGILPLLAFLQAFTAGDHVQPRMPGLSPWGGGGGIYPNFLCPTYMFFIFFLNRETHFGRCPMLPSPPLNTKHSVDQPCTHDIPSNTKHSVCLYHALTPMSCDVLVHNAMQSCHCSFIPCYTYDECYMCMPTHA